MTWGYVAGAAISVVGGYLNSRNANKGSASVSQQPSMTPEQQAAYTSLLNRLQGRTSATTPYGGDLAVGSTPGMKSSLAALEQQSLDMSKNNEALRARLMGMTNQDTASGSEKDVEDYYQHGIEDPAVKSLNERILPSITQRFKGNAAFGTDRQLAERNAVGDLTSSLSSAKSKLIYDTREAAKSRDQQAHLAAAGMLPGLDKNMSDALMSIFGANAADQSVQQGAADRKYQDFLRNDEGENRNMAMLMQALGLGNPNTVVTPGTPNGFATGLGSAAGNFSALALQRWLKGDGGTGGTSTPTSFGGAYPDAGGGPNYG